MSFFSVSDLTAGYGGQPVVEKISFELNAGCLMGILGANGSGKTTLLKAVCGILPHKGRCLLETGTQEETVLEELPPRKLAGLCGYIPQRSGISMDISVLDVVLMGFNPRLGLLQYPSGEMKMRAQAALKQVGLPGKEEENYQYLSEGQKQLVILARTLAGEGRLLLLDEPESALDFCYRYQMLDLLKNWIGKEKRAGLAALHDPALALNYCDSLLLLSKGQVRSVLRPGTDPLEKMEKELSDVYGCVSLHWCRDRSGRKQLVMLKEAEG